MQGELPASTESKTFSTPRDQEKWATKTATICHNHISRFSPSMSPDEGRVPREPSFSLSLYLGKLRTHPSRNCVWEQAFIPLTHHFPKSAYGILNLVPLHNCNKSKWHSFVKCHPTAWTPALYKQIRNTPCSNLTIEQNSPIGFLFCFSFCDARSYLWPLGGDQLYQTERWAKTQGEMIGLA